MIDPIITGQTKDFILEADRKSKNPTIWKLGGLDSMQKAFLTTMNENTVSGEKGESVSDLIKTTFLIVKHGLKDVKNFGNQPIEIETEQVDFMGEKVTALSDSFLRKIPLFAINEIAVAIIKENEISEELEKN